MLPNGLLQEAKGAPMMVVILSRKQGNINGRARYVPSYPLITMRAALAIIVYV